MERKERADGQEDLEERLLSAWLRLAVQISNERVVTDMPFKEALVCNLLSKAPEGKLTATDLCEQTKTLKSQMNRVLGSMEEKGLIFRERSTVDKRQIDIRLNEEKSGLYRQEHNKNLRLVNAIIEKFGKEKTEGLLEELAYISDVIGEVLE